MNIYLVNQNKKNEEEINGKYLFVGYEEKDGKRHPDSNKLKEMEKGDIILHKYNGNIEVISKVVSKEENIDSPYEDSNKGIKINVQTVVESINLKYSEFGKWLKNNKSINGSEITYFNNVDSAVYICYCMKLQEYEAIMLLNQIKENNECSRDKLDDIIVKYYEHLIGSNNFIIETLVTSVLGDCSIIKVNNVVIMVDGYSEYRLNFSSDYSEKMKYRKRVEAALKRYEKIDIIVVTHVDDDHIGGFNYLLKNSVRFKKLIKDAIVIYNDFKNIKNGISYKQADAFEQLLEVYGLKNISSNNNTVRICSKCFRILSNSMRIAHCQEYDNELKKEKVIITILGPCLEEYQALMNDYKRWKKNETSKANPHITNNSSIILMIEYNDKKVLFTGDSSVDIIEKSLKDYKIKFDLIKIPHHGSINNCKELGTFAKSHDCKNFLVFGDQKEFDDKEKQKHPDSATIKDLIEKCNANLKIFSNVNCKNRPEYGQYFDNSEVIVIDK